MYSMKKSIRDFFRELLELLFQAAALVIDVLRTFFLIVLSILGPLCFAISVWDGFQSTLTQWFCRYIQIYLWLPVSDLFSTILAKIQVLMLQNDIEALQNDPNFSRGTCSRPALAVWASAGSCVSPRPRAPDVRTTDSFRNSPSPAVTRTGTQLPSD